MTAIIRKNEIKVTAILGSAFLLIQCFCFIHTPAVHIGNTLPAIPSAVSNASAPVHTSVAAVSAPSRSISPVRKGETALSSQLQLELLGVALGSKKDPIAFIKDLHSGTQSIYRLGKEVQGATIVRIAKGTVTLEKDGKTAELVLSTRARDWARGQGKRREENALVASEGHILVDRETLLTQAGSIYQSVRRMKVQPHKVAGQTVGLKVNGITEGSLIAEAGIHNDDIITSVNNQKIDSYQKALQVFQKVRGRNTIDVSVVRDGEIKQLSYRIN